MATTLTSSSCCRPAVAACKPQQQQTSAAARFGSAPTHGLKLESAQARRSAQRLSLTVCRAEAADTEVAADDWAKVYVDDATKYDDATPPEFKLRFVWLPKNVGVAVDQIFGGEHKSPLTEFFFWPRRDAWEELKACLETKNWISERETVLLLNRTTEVINYWQERENEKYSVEEARDMFPDCEFLTS